MAKIEMEIINPHCAVINIGSRSPFVAVGQGDKDVQQFGVYPDELIISVIISKIMASHILLWKVQALTIADSLINIIVYQLI